MIPTKEGVIRWLERQKDIYQVEANDAKLSSETRKKAKKKVLDCLISVERISLLD